MDTYTGLERADGDAPVDETDGVQEPSPTAGGRPAGSFRRRLAREAGLVLLFYYTYQTIRSAANVGNVRPRAFANSNRLVAWERSLHIYTEQAFQRFFLSARWLLKTMNIYYGTFHFIITAGLLIWLFVRRSDAYRRMRNLLGATTALALIGYWSFPLAPPRMRQWEGYVDTLDSIGGLWSYESDVAKAVANPFAAMPSLHFGWSLWCAVVFYRYASHRVTRLMCIAYPALTLFAIVVTANHYWLDAAGGALTFVAGIGVMRLIDSVSLRRRPATATKA